MARITTSSSAAAMSTAAVGESPKMVVRSTTVERGRAERVAIHAAVCVEQARRLGLVVVRHRFVRIVPLAQDTESLKIPCLTLQGIGGEFVVHMTVDPSGAVTDVKIVSGSPRGIFERDIKRSMGKCKFEPTSTGFIAEAPIVFRMEN